MTSRSPRGSFVYRILSLIDLLSLAPVSSPKDADDFGTVGEADSQDSTANLAEAVVPLLRRTVGYVFRDDAPNIGEGKLRHREGYPVLSLVLLVLVGVPIEPRLRHGGSLTPVWPFSHINVWARDGGRRSTWVPD